MIQSFPYKLVQFLNGWTGSNDCQHFCTKRGIKVNRSQTEQAVEESPGMNLVFSIISSSDQEISELLIARGWDSVWSGRLHLEEMCTCFLCLFVSSCYRPLSETRYWDWGTLLAVSFSYCQSYKILSVCVCLCFIFCFVLFFGWLVRWFFWVGVIFSLGSNMLFCQLQFF